MDNHLPDLQEFTTPSGKTTIRTIVGADGEPWFIAKDVCDVLGYSDSGQALRNLDADEKGTYPAQYAGQVRNLSIISESGFYSLVLRSRKPVAKKFKAWVTKEVLPSIRKHGMYATPDTVERMLADPDVGIKVFKALKAEKDARMEAEGIIEEQRPMVEYADKTTDGMQFFLLTNAARYFGIGRTQLTAFLVDIEFLEGRVIGGKYRYRPTQDTRNAELATTLRGNQGYYITAAGMEYIQHQLDSQEVF